MAINYPDEPEPADGHRWAVAERIADALLERYSTDIHAIGVHGALAHGEDIDGGEVEMAVVTSRAGTGPSPGSRRIEGVIVDLDVLSAEGCMTMARTLSPSWPLRADRYLTARALHDPKGWHDRIRDAHLTFLAEATTGEFAELARQAWCRSMAARTRAMYLAEHHDTDGAVLTLGESRLAAALSDGLLNRTYFRDSADAIRRTGLGDTSMVELATKLSVLAETLAGRGYPVDGSPDEL